MKKTLSILLVAIMILSLAATVPTFVSAKEEQGAATAISNGADFAIMQANGNYYLTADITVSATYTSEFTGTFDGKGHKITTTAPLFDVFSGTATDFTIEGTVSSTKDRAGVFCNSLGNAKVSKIINKATLNGSTTKVTSEDALELNGAYGSIAGTVLKSVSPEVSDCTNYGKITGYTAGGFFGKAHANNVTYKNLTNLGDIVGTDCGAGITGWEWGDCTFENCVNGSKTVKPSITTDSDAAGGIVSYISGSTKVSYIGCVNYGNCHSTNSGAGGIAGRGGDKDDFTFRNCINYGEIKGDNGYAGGICGGDNGLIDAEYCFNYGTVYGGKQGGGIVAHIGCKDKDGQSRVVYCGNEGSVTTGTDTCGGVVGYAYGLDTKPLLIEYCYNTGDVKGGCEAGGIFGYTNNMPGLEIRYCFNTGMISTTNANEIAVALYFNKNADPAAAGLIKDNYYLAGCATKEARTHGSNYSDMNSNLTAADFASGKVCYMLNQAAGKEVFRQTIGTDAAPTLNADSKSVIFEGGQYSNPQPPVTGDSIVIVAVIATVSIFGMGIALYRKHN